MPLFGDLSEPELAWVAERLSACRYQSGQVISAEGERGGDLLMVREGCVRVLKTAASGRHQLIAIERAAGSLGEVSVFDGGVYSATAVAAAPALVLRLEGVHFRKLCAAHPEVARKVIGTLGRRLRQARQLVEQLSFETVRDRLIDHSLKLGKERGERMPAGTRVRLDKNNEELAARLGMVRELVSRNLGRLYGEGLIVMRRREVTIPDEAALRRELTKSGQKSWCRRPIAFTLAQ